MPVQADTPGKSTEEIALFPLNTVLFPGGPLPLRIFEPRYVDMVGTCLREQRGFGVVLIREGSEVGAAEFETLGTLARIVDFHMLSDGLLGLTTIGERRFRIQAHERRRDGLHVGQVQWLDFERPQPLPAEYGHLPGVLETLLNAASDLYASIERKPEDASWVSCRLAELLPLTLPSRQFCLELEDPLERLRLLGALIKVPGD
jgi:Lon protease-like protein